MQKRLKVLNKDIRILKEQSGADHNSPHKQELKDEYSKLLENKPKYEDYFGRPYYYHRYTDEYDTGTDFSLRELYLLVWWGRYHTGRDMNTKIPGYFFSRYNLNGQKVTEKFLQKGYLALKDGRYYLTDQGKLIANDYREVWDMDQVNGFPICLDEDFPRWHHGQLLRDFYQKDIDFLTARINYRKEIVAFLNKHPDYYDDPNVLKRRLDKLTSVIRNSKQKIESDRQKIEGLE